MLVLVQFYIENQLNLAPAVAAIQLLAAIQWRQLFIANLDSNLTIQKPMQPQPDDWRLQGQEKYLFGAVLRLKKYSDRKTTTDHDHCEFCFAKFSDTIPDALNEGYTTQDDYRWICDKCFADFKDKFKFTFKS